MNVRYYFSLTIVWTIIIVSMVSFFPVFFILWLLSRPFDSRNFFVHWMTSKWAYFYVFVSSGKKLHVKGRENVKAEQPCLFISNHQSMMDIAALFQVYPHFLWVSKLENFKAPILGWVMSLNGYIKLDRNSPRSFPKMVADCSEAVKKGDSIIIFPEGTRSKTNELGRFKDGAFKIAIKNKLPIIPVVLDGTGTILPKKNANTSIHSNVTINILPKIEYADFPSEDPAVLKEYFRDMMAAELQKIRS